MEKIIQELNKNLIDINQFYHDKYEGRTYAVEVAFNREDLLECIHYFERPVAFKIGKSRVHPNDNYCKKTGREVSAGQMKPVMLYFQGMYKEDVPVGVENDNKMFLVFAEKGGPAYTFRVHGGFQDKVHFIKVR